MSEVYFVRWRAPGQKRWEKIDDINGDGVEPKAGFRWFRRKNGEMIYTAIASEVIFGKEREIAIAKAQSRQAGQSVQTEPGIAEG